MPHEFIAIGLGLFLLFVTLDYLSRSSKFKQFSHDDLEIRIAAKLRMSLPLPDRFESDVSSLVESNRKVEALKLVRNATRMDLPEAMRLIEIVAGGTRIEDLLELSNAKTPEVSCEQAKDGTSGSREETDSDKGTFVDLIAEKIITVDRNV